MAGDTGKVYPQEIQLLKKEIEVQGEILNQERLERKAEIDRLRLEFDSFKQLFEELQPGFLKHFEAMFNREKQSWNPELEKRELPIHAEVIPTPLKKTRRR